MDVRPNTAALLLLITLVGGQVACQERQRDTTTLRHIELLDAGMDSGGATFLIPPHLAPGTGFASPTFFFEGVPTIAPVGRPQFGLELKQDLLAPLRAQWAREARTSTFRSIMGSIQFAGVLYLAGRQLAGSPVMTAKPRPARSRSK